MINDDALSKRLKSVQVNEIDVSSSVLNKINNKKNRIPRKTLLIAAMIVMTVTIVFASVWIMINDNGSYTIQDGQKKWNTEFSMATDLDGETYKIYSKVYKNLIEISFTEGKNLIGYYMSDELEKPFLLTSNNRIRYPKSRIEEFYIDYDYQWIKVVENSVPDNYNLSGATAQITYSEEYFSSWQEHAKIHAVDGQLYYEEIDSPKIPASLRLNFTRLSEGTLRKFDASIIMVSTKGTVQSRASDSEIVSIEGAEGVFTNLSSGYMLLEVVYDGNLLTLHANLKGDGKVILIETMKKIIKGLK